MKRGSDKRRMRLVRKALHAIEDPAKGIVFDDFDLRYREREHVRELKSAEWFYRDKLSFETKYAADCGDDPCNEPAWVTDRGQGAATLRSLVSFDLDGDENRVDDPTRPSGRSSDWNRRRKSALERVRRQLPHALETLKLIIRNIDNRKESICSLVKSQLSSRRNGNSRGRSTPAT